MTTANQEPVLRVEHLHVYFGKGAKRVHAVNDVCFEIYPGETFGLVGESGSGKTTIGRTIMGLTPADGGEISFEGRRISGRLSVKTRRQLAGELQMIFQDPDSSLNSRSKVYDIVEEGLCCTRKDMDRKQREEAVREVLQRVGLSAGAQDRFPHEFSGGQRQRISIARAIVMKPSFLIADEPVSALDMSLRAQVLQLLLQLQEQYHFTYLMISHDISLMRAICGRIAVIERGRIVETAPTEEIFKNPLHPYTRMLLSAVPIPNPRRERKKTLFSYERRGIDPERKAETIEVTPGHYVLMDKS